MSVAFRRDSDEEHREPTFELPIPPGPNRVTPRGRALIDERIAELETALAATSDDAAAAAVRRDLRYWRTRRATAIETAAPSDGTVGFGSVVAIRLAGAERTIHIVGDDEADPPRGYLASGAPLARALIGAEAGEHVAFNGRGGAIEVFMVS